MSEVTVADSSFKTVIGVEHTAIIDAIQNSPTEIQIKDSTIEDCLSYSGLISLNVAKINIIRTKFLGNYAKINTNGISMLKSEVIIEDSEISNQRNNLNIPSEILSK